MLGGGFPFAPPWLPTPWFHEAVASATLAFCFGTIGVTLRTVGLWLGELGHYLPPRQLAEAVPALLFAWLLAFLSPAFARASRGARMNPAVLLLEWSLGAIRAGDALRGSAAVLGGTATGQLAWHVTNQRVFGGGGVRAVVHNGSFEVDGGRDIAPPLGLGDGWVRRLVPLES